MLHAPCSMLNVQFFLTYAHTHTHMHFKKAPPSNRSFPRGPCGRCKGEDEVEAEAGEKRRSIGDGRRDVRGSSTSNTENCNPRPVHGRVPTARVPPRERERRLPGCCATSRSAARREWRASGGNSASCQGHGGGSRVLNNMGGLTEVVIDLLPFDHSRAQRVKGR